MNKVVAYLKNEPVRVFAAVVAVLTVLVTFKVIPGADVNDVEGVAAAVLALFGGEAVRSVVSPTDSSTPSKG